MIELYIKENEGNQRIDKFLRKYMPKAPLSLIYRLIRKKQVKVNHRKISNYYILKTGDIIQLYINEKTIEEFVQTRDIKYVKKDFSIVYEDSNILLVNKPRGLLTHSARDGDQNTLIEQAISYLYEKGEYDPLYEKTFVPACVNRLDRNTGGLILIGKNNESLQDLNKMMRERFIRRYYLTIVKGSIMQGNELKGRLIKGDDNKVRSLQNHTNKGKPMHTIYKPIYYNEDWSLLEVEIVTGRTHQIRLHLSDIGHPIVGDVKYGDAKVNKQFYKKYGLKYQLLHAHKVCFENTTHKFNYLKEKSFYFDLPDNFKQIKKDLFSDLL